MTPVALRYQCIWCGAKFPDRDTYLAHAKQEIGAPVVAGSGLREWASLS